MKFGLIGHPIEHSLSPALFRAGYDGRYPYELLVTPDFDEAFRRFADGNYDGINVTAPFKELALKKADIISEECRLTGATNLLMKTPEGIAAYNSDFRGLCIWLKHISNMPSPESSDKPTEAEDQKSVLAPWPQAWEGFFLHPLCTPSVRSYLSLSTGLEIYPIPETALIRESAPICERAAT